MLGFHLGMVVRFSMGMEIGFCMLMMLVVFWSTILSIHLSMRTVNERFGMGMGMEFWLFVVMMMMMMIGFHMGRYLVTFRGGRLLKFRMRMLVCR